MRVPSGDQATALTGLLCPRKEAMPVTPFRVPTFHIRTVVSSLAEARRVLSGDQASALTFFVWVRGVTQSCVPAGGISVCSGCDIPAGGVCIQRFVGVLIPSMKLEGASSSGRGCMRRDQVRHETVLSRF